MFRLVFEPHHGRASGADSGEKHEPAGDIDTAVVDSLKALDPGRPIREADIRVTHRHVGFGPNPDIPLAIATYGPIADMTGTSVTGQADHSANGSMPSGGARL